MKQVTVIIPNYNGKIHLNQCLEEVYRNTTIEMDVIVVDNGSNDDSIRQARALYPQVKYVELDQNYGFSKAVNVGIELTETPYVFLLNNDAFIKKGCIERLLKTIKKNKQIFSVEAKILQYQEPDKIDSAGTYYQALGWAFARGNGSEAEKYNQRAFTFASCGAAALYRKDILDIIGRFDEKYFAYLEDIDVGYRAKIAGYRNVYEPEAQVLHVGSATTGSKYNDFKVQYSARNNMYLIYKNMPGLQILWNAPLLIPGFMVKAAFFVRKGFGLQYLKGIREGVELCRNSKKQEYKHMYLKNYVQIQMELWVNIFKKRW